MKVIVDYMVTQNRPYGATDVYNNLHQEFGKTLVVKCLDSAVESGILREKAISKQKIYYANQDNLETCEENELMAMDREITEKSERLNDLSAQLKSMLSELKSLESTLTTSELAEATNSLEIQISGMEKCKSELEANQYAVNTDDKKNAEQRYQSLDALFRKRRRIAEEMIGAIHENCPMQKKALLVCRAGKMQGSLKIAPDTTKNTPFLSLLSSYERE
uniref:TBPIP domain-containing protein n=1 Tax=Ascaris lumbricoides TaxID=6252 RepID=A0A0M3I808_ASCLU